MSKRTRRLSHVNGGGIPMRPVPMVGRSNTMRQVGFTGLQPLPPQPGMPGDPPVLLGLRMVRSDGVPVDINVPLPQHGRAIDYAQIIGQGLVYLQTYLNCRCRPGTPEAPGELCERHKPQDDASKKPTGIVLTDG